MFSFRLKSMGLLIHVLFDWKCALISFGQETAISQKILRLESLRLRIVVLFTTSFVARGEIDTAVYNLCLVETMNGSLLVVCSPRSAI